MNWTLLRRFPWLDTRASFVADTPAAGTLVDLGSSDGETLRHFAELRPDLKFVAVDRSGNPNNYPVGSRFLQVDLERDKLALEPGSVDAVTCTHLVEHLHDLSPLMAEVARILKPGGRVYFETPHPKSLVLSSAPGVAAGTFPMNFYDDSTHVRMVSAGALGHWVRGAGLRVTASGTSRNWLFAAAYPVLFFFPGGRKKFTSYLHWVGWSAYLAAVRP